MAKETHVCCGCGGLCDSSHPCPMAHHCKVYLTRRREPKAGEAEEQSYPSTTAAAGFAAYVKSHRNSGEQAMVSKTDARRWRTCIARGWTPEAYLRKEVQFIIRIRDLNATLVAEMDKEAKRYLEAFASKVAYERACGPEKRYG